LRCLKIAKYLRDYGWEPVIYTAENAHYPAYDPGNEKDVPQDLTILRQPIWEPYAWYKRLTGKDKDANVNNVFYVQEDKQSWLHRLSVWVRSNFFIPDARAAWIKPSVRYLTNYLQANPVDAIFSDGPPHTNTRIATLVSQATGIPHLADFQDPWTQVDYYQLLSLTAWADRKHHRLEQESFRQASAITIVSPTWKRDLEAIGAANVHVIPWGYDPDDYSPPQEEKLTRFSLTHIGILGYDRLPAELFRVLFALKAADTDFDNDLALNFIGQVDPAVKESYTQEGLAAYVHTPGFLPRAEALAASRESAILLLPLNQQPNAQGRIPGKLFEYLALRRPILALGPVDSDVAHILRETGSGVCLDYQDQAGLKQQLLEWYAAFRQGQLGQPVQSNIEAYNVQRLTGRIASLLDAIVVEQ
jgi:glycosyltransferase involved in cell wall biosynthesis